MPQRPGRNYQPPKGKLNSLASAYLMNNASQVKPDAAAMEAGKADAATSALNDMEGSADPNAIQPTMINQLQPPVYQKPGFWRNLLSQGHAGMNYSNAVQRLGETQYELAGREALQGQKFGMDSALQQEKAIFDSLIAKEKHGYQLTEQEQQAKAAAAQAMTNHGYQMDQIKATATWKEGLPPELYNSVGLPTAINKHRLTQQEQKAQLGFTMSPEYDPLVRGKMRADMQKSGVDNQGVLAAAERALAAALKDKTDAKMAPWTNINDAAINRETGEYFTSTPARQIDPLMEQVPAQVGRVSFRKAAGGELNNMTGNSPASGLPNTIARPQEQAVMAPVQTPQPQATTRFANPYISPTQLDALLNQAQEPEMPPVKLQPRYGAVSAPALKTVPTVQSGSWLDQYLRGGAEDLEQFRNKRPKQYAPY